MERPPCTTHCTILMSRITTKLSLGARQPSKAPFIRFPSWMSQGDHQGTRHSYLCGYDRWVGEPVDSNVLRCLGMCLPSWSMWYLVEMKVCQGGFLSLLVLYSFPVVRIVS
ncbi:hypothetical protein PAXRUDRAFT_425182 [Paxillus rubicundulus Ve08.2h10]|uniref:Uncharacterized protein n=1 Tax=Paxillus rubicundulus Ve08.2h10 TaxID=930991 RepID=A0A0D0E8B8_9AGAM|nr:hypothetical protein PAXRUDRAFT_425182 [Paxillus rubicundulus Ve08.2h10]